MTKKEIRTQYSGLIFFAAKLITVVTGILFTLLVARSVTQEEYGVWGTLNIIVPYFTIMSSALPFWVMRFVARNREGATKTGVLANAGIGAAATLIYVALLPLIVPTFGLENYVMLYGIAAMQIIEIYLIAVLEGCLQAQQPHYVGFGLLVGEVCKVVLAYLFIAALQLSILGAFLSITIAFGIKVVFYFKTVWTDLRQKMVVNYVKEWLKGSTFNIYNFAGDRIAAILFLMIPIFGGEIATSYYQAAAPIANIITYSAFLAFALYPKILAENKLDEATASLKLVLMFAIPMAAGVFAIPSSFLLILNPIYGEAWPILIILAVDALIVTLTSIYGAVLFGIERVDEKAEVPFRQVAKSRLFVYFSLPYLHSIITLPTAYYLLTTFTQNQPLLVAIYALAINTTAKLAMFLVQYGLVRSAVKVEIPWKNVAKYVFASLVMAAVLFAFHPTRTYLTFVITAVGGIIYIGILLAIDKEARMLLKDIWREARKGLNRN